MIGLLLAVVMVSAPQGVPAECFSPCTVSANQPFEVITDADLAVDSYVLLINGQPAGITAHVANGLVAFSHPGFAAASSVTLLVRATRLGVSFTYTDPFALSVVKRRIKIIR